MAISFLIVLTIQVIKPNILHAYRERFTLSSSRRSRPRTRISFESFDLKLLFAKFPIFVWNTSHERALLNFNVNPILVILKVWGLLRDRFDRWYLYSSYEGMINPLDVFLNPFRHKEWILEYLEKYESRQNGNSNIFQENRYKWKMYFF